MVSPYTVVTLPVDIAGYAPISHERLTCRCDMRLSPCERRWQQTGNERRSRQTSTGC